MVQTQNSYKDFPRFVVEYKPATDPINNHAAWQKLADEAEDQLNKAFAFIHGVPAWANIVLYGATCIGQQIKFWIKTPAQATVALTLPTGVQLDNYLSLMLHDEAGKIDTTLIHILEQAFV